MSAPRIPGLTYIQHIGQGGFADVFLYEQQWPRQRIGSGGQLGGDHRHGHTLRSNRVDRPRQIGGGAFGRHVPLGPHGQIHPVEPGVLDRPPELVPAELREMFREEQEGRAVGGAARCRRQGRGGRRHHQFTSREHLSFLQAAGLRPSVSSPNRD